MVGDKLAFAKTISEADLATAVPDPIAMPISAFFKATKTYRWDILWETE